MKKDTWRSAVSGAAAGAANGLFGGGGGSVLVPLLTRFCGLEQRQAFSTSLAVILPLCVLSAAVYLVRGGLDLAAALLKMNMGDDNEDVIDCTMPARSLDELDSFVPVVEMLPGWECDISGCRTYEELPENAKAYIRILEQLLNHEIQFISVGARRDQFLTKGAWL